LLSWTPISDPGRAVVIRIERMQLSLPAATETRRSPLAPAPPPAAQALAVRTQDGVDPGHAIDTSALSNQQYRYTLERVTTLALGGQSVEIQGSPSEPIPVLTKDAFPPAVPQGLVAVADSAAGAIDLSWMPDSEPDLAAYHIYRRDLQGDAPARQIASVGVETSFRDTGVEARHTYAYSVSAVDQTGNESNRSPEVKETLPGR
jgi:fibronectin type 3 domain-containing protein